MKSAGTGVMNRIIGMNAAVPSNFDRGPVRSGIHICGSVGVNRVVAIVAVSVVRQDCEVGGVSWFGMFVGTAIVGWHFTPGVGVPPFRIDWGTDVAVIGRNLVNYVETGSFLALWTAEEGLERAPMVLSGERLHCC